MDFDWTPEQRALRVRVAEFADATIARYGAHRDSWSTGSNRDCARELAAEGWIGMTWPVEVGGGGRSSIDRFIVSEGLISAGVPIASMWIADRQMGPALIAFGTDEQRRRFLPGMLSGDDTWCIGMSEPNAGSDLASLRTSAERRTDGWLINGQKIWTSLAAEARYCYLICRTSIASDRHAGISEIVVDMSSSGIEVRPIRDMSGSRRFCEVFFDDVHVPLENLVGTEGAAFSQTMRQLEHERGGIDRLLSNFRLYRSAVAAADTSDRHVRQEITRLECDYRIGRLLVLREALGQAPRGFSAATKCFCTEHEIRVAQFAAHVVGADAMLWDELAKSVAYAPGYTIMGGTSNILRNILAERLLRLPRT